MDRVLILLAIDFAGQISGGRCRGQMQRAAVGLSAAVMSEWWASCWWASVHGRKLIRRAGWPNIHA